MKQSQPVAFANVDRVFARVEDRCRPRKCQGCHTKHGPAKSAITDSARHFRQGDVAWDLPRYTWILLDLDQLEAVLQENVDKGYSNNGNANLRGFI